jgi:hypothetical protein
MIKPTGIATMRKVPKRAGRRNWMLQLRPSRHRLDAIGALGRIVSKFVDHHEKGLLPDARGGAKIRTTPHSLLFLYRYV